MRFGIIGSGNSATNIAKSLSILEEAQIIGITSKDPLQAKQLMEDEMVDIEKFYENTQELLATPEIEAVVISVPHHLHHPLVIEALNAGKHVLCEKPLAITIKQGEEMIILAKEKNLNLGTFFQMRFNKSSEKAKEIIQENLLGKIIHARVSVLWSRNQEYYESSPWRGKWETEGGGSLINQSIHSIDLLIWLLGEPKLVFGVYGTRTHNIEVDDNSASLILFKNDIYASIHTSTSMNPGYPTEIKIYGTKGSISLSGDTVEFTNAEGTVEIFDYKVSKVANESDPKKFSKFAHTALIQDFLKSIQENRLPKIDGIEGMRAIRVVQAIYESKGNKIIYFE